MILYLAGLAAFFGTHFFSATRSRAPDRDLRARLGYGRYMSGYSLLAGGGLVLLIYGYGMTRGMGVLYVPPLWTQHLTLLLTLPAMVLLIASQLPAGYIKKVTKHPMLLAVKLWAFGHLLANGEYNSVLLFGSFLGFAVFDRIMVKRRGDDGVGPDIALNPVMDGLSLVVGLAVWAAIAFWLHPILFGVAAIA